MQKSLATRGVNVSLRMQTLKLTESDRLLVQIQAYLDNVFDVGALLEDAEARNALLEHVEELQEQNTQVHTQAPTHHHTHPRDETNVRLCFGCPAEFQAAGE